MNYEEIKSGISQVLDAHDSLMEDNLIRLSHRPRGVITERTIQYQPTTKEIRDADGIWRNKWH